MQAWRTHQLAFEDGLTVVTAANHCGEPSHSNICVKIGKASREVVDSANRPKRMHTSDHQQRRSPIGIDGLIEGTHP